MTKTILMATCAVALVSCGKQDGAGDPAMNAAAIEESAAGSAADSMVSELPGPPAVRYEAPAERFSPNVGVTAAPGVAFNYRYAFRVPNTAIARVQEQHAQMCEKLGIDRCRITGMRYRLIDEDNVSAMLALKLDPTLARQFGKDSISRVSEAEGMLVDSEIAGIDAGSAIASSTRMITALQDQLRKFETQLRDARSASERETIRQQIEQVQSQIRARQTTRSEEQESLATTPMVFNYGSGRVVPGFDNRSPLRDAFAMAGDAFESILAGIIIVLGALLPIAAIVLVLLWLWRRLRIGGRREQPSSGAASEPKVETL